MDPALEQEIAQGAVAGVAPRVVGLQAPGGDGVSGEELERALDERDDGRRLLVAMDLGVGQAAVVVDHRVTELPAHALAALGGGAMTIARDGVSRRAEA